MGASPERTRHDLPKWWTDLAWPLLEKKETNYADVAAMASKYAGRKSPWGGTAITKFKQGTAGRTRELANAISHALKIPQPYFEARSPKESRAITELMSAFDPTVNMTVGQTTRLEALDSLEDEERRAALDQRDRITSADDERAVGSRRTRRPPRRRS